MGHTPEPWGDETHARVPQICHGWVRSIHYAMSDEDKQRADLCVNACTGMADPAGEIRRLRAELVALRDEVKATRKVLNVLQDKKYGEPETVVRLADCDQRAAMELFYARKATDDAALPAKEAE